MASFCNDSDILKYELVLFGELHLPGQVLIEGTGGVLSGTTFTASGADFVSAQAAVGGVVNLQSADGVLDMCVEIVSVDSATVLTVSVIRADSLGSAVAPPGASSISYRVSTFGPQVSEAAYQLTEHFGIGPGNPASVHDSDDIMDTSVLKQASVFAVISAVYAMLASQTKDDNYWQKSVYYQKLFEKSRQRCRLSIDSGNDGVVDVTMIGSSVRLVRD